MGRLMVAVDRAARGTPEVSAAQWGRDDETAALGRTQDWVPPSGGQPGLTVPADRPEPPRIAALLERFLEAGLSASIVDRPDDRYAAPDALRLSTR